MWLKATILLGAVTPTLSAQEEDWSRKRLEELRRTHVITASGFSQPFVATPAKVVTLRAEEIRRRGYLDLEELLHDLGGFDFNRTMGIEWSTIFMRGFRSSNSDRFLLIWDGVIQNDPWKQNVWLSRQYPLARVQRVEVMYGPASLLYGANAMAGIINVILRPLEEVRGVEAEATAGAFNTRALDASWTGGLGPWSFQVAARAFRSDEANFNGKGWTDAAGRFRAYDLRIPGDLIPPSDPANALNYSGGFPTYSHNGQPRILDGRYSNPTRDWYVSGAAAWRGLSLKAFAWSTEEGQGQWYTALNKVQSPWTPYGGALELAHERGTDGPWVQRTYAHLRYAGIDGDRSFGLRHRVLFTSDPTDPRDLKLTRTDPSLFSKLFARELRFGHRSTLQRARFDAVLGGEFIAADLPEDYHVRSRDTEAWSATPRHQERNLGIFANAQFKLHPRFELSAGSRFDRNFHAGEPGGFGNLSTSRLAGIWAPHPDHHLKLIWGQGYQAPPAFQKFSTAPAIRDLPAPDLQPEKLQSWEFMYGFGPALGWEASLNLFRSRVKGFITLTTVPFGTGSTTQYRNLGGVTMEGAELEVRYRGEWGEGWFNAGSHRAEDSGTGRKVGDIAPLKLNGGLTWRPAPHWGLSLRGHYVGPRDTVNWDSPSPYVVRRVSPYATWEASVTAFQLARGLDLRLSIQNLLNRAYYDPGARTADGKTYNAVALQPPFRAYLTLTWRR
ncbi:MAG: TonB-dependent receptor [Acidobacteria bacterium]|nr:TonB-dependent receptor [Acidobacteriota bacterium]